MARVREALGDTDGVEVEFLEEVIGNSSPVESPLMDAIRDWVGEPSPGAEAVPTVLPAFTDSRWFRDAFPDCVAYGFFPQRHMTPVRHVAADPRRRRADRRPRPGLRREVLPRAAEEAAGMTEPDESSASAAWPCATGCSSTGRRTGRPPCGRATARSRSARARSRACARVDDVPGVRGVVRLGEAMVVIPLVKRALPQARLPFQDASVLGVAAGASLTGALARKRLRGVGGESIAALVSVAPALFALRGGELAAVPRRRAQGDRRLRAGRRGRERRLQGARALRLAPRRAAARLQPGRDPAAAARARAAGPDGGRRGRARLDRGGRRGVRLVRAQRRDAAREGAAAARASRSSG